LAQRGVGELKEAFGFRIDKDDRGPHGARNLGVHDLNPAKRLAPCESMVRFFRKPRAPPSIVASPGYRPASNWPLWCRKRVRKNAMLSMSFPCGPKSRWCVSRRLARMRQGRDNLGIYLPAELSQGARRHSKCRALAASQVEHRHESSRRIPLPAF